jgi:hypothetical protein
MTWFNTCWRQHTIFLPCPSAGQHPPILGVELGAHGHQAILRTEIWCTWAPVLPPLSAF